MNENISAKRVLLQRQIEEKMYQSFPIVPKATESITERIQRIRAELNEVEKVLKYSQLQSAVISSGCENAKIYQDLKTLEAQYLDIVNSKEYSKILSSNKKDQAEAVQSAKIICAQMTNAITQLKSYMPTTQNQINPSKTVIELYQNTNPPNPKLAALETRLKSLESKVGAWKKQVYTNLGSPKHCTISQKHQQ